MTRLIQSLLATSAILLSGCTTMVSDYKPTTLDKREYSSENVEELDYDTNSYVIETSGGGEIACINLGTKDKVNRGTRVEFYRIERRNGETFEVVFATGIVFLASDSTSWVKVNNPKKANVMRNHFVKVAQDQVKSFKESMEWLFQGY